MLVYRWEQSAYDNQCQPFLPQRNLYVVEIMLEELSKKTHEGLIQNLLQKVKVTILWPIVNYTNIQIADFMADIGFKYCAPVAVN